MVLESNTLDLLFVKDGEQGTDGKMLYTWIKYAKDDKGTDMTDDPQSAVYIGISYNNESNIESDDPTQYAWTKIQGADGKKGEDAYTIVLENENISFATDGDRNPLSEQAYTSRITVMKGATPVTDFGIGDIAKTQGIAIAKGDDGISISVVNGNPLHTDSGEITVPISVGGTVFKKVLTWTCAKKGEQGVKGDTGAAGKNGTSVTITSKSVTYQTSTSGTTTPTGTWQATVPTVANGQYLWTKTTVQYSDGNKTEAYGVSYKGTNGQNGSSITVSKNEVTYQVSTSGTTTPTGTWSTTMPSCDQGQYLWTKTYVKYSDGKETTSYSVSYRGVDGADGQDGDSFAWNMLSHSSMIGEKIVCQYIEPCNSVITYQYTDEGYHIVTPSSGNANNGIVIRFDNYKDLGIDDGESISFSCDIKGSTSSKPCIAIRMGDNLWYGNDVVGKSATFTPTNNWQRFSVSTTTPSNLTKRHIWLAIHGNLQSDLYIKNLKLEKGISATPWSPSQSDIEGKGVSETVQYYLATSQASGVTSSTSGWSTDITTQKITADKKYLWNCYQTKYSDGTSEPISTPTIIGAYGDKGQNAKSITITPSAQIFKSTDGGNTFAPNQITITPTLQGDITFGKWQYSIDGGVSFADVVSGQSGLSVDANKKLTIAKTSGLFTDKVTMVTFRAVASDSSFYDTCSIAKLYDVTDIEIGGVNLIKNSNFADGINKWVYMNITCAVETDSTYGHHIKFSSSVGGDTNHRLFSDLGSNFNHVEDTMYTLSFYAKASANTQVQTNVACTTNKNNYSLTTSWQRFTFTYQASAAGSLTFWAVEANKDIYLANIKLERGNKATDWSPAPEDVQTAIFSTKSEISDVSLKVDNNKQAIEQRVEKTTYQQDLTLVKGDISKANEGLNKWRYEIYPKSLFASEYQGKSTMDVFAKNTNLTPSQSVLINDTDLSIAWNYDNNYIGYALTFVKFSAAKSVAITFAHDDGAHIYLNGKLIGGNDGYNNKGESLTLGFVKGWNCIEVVVNEGASTEGFKLGTTLSAISECQLMNCYYGTPVARQSHITNQLVENTTNIKGINTKVSKVTSVIGDNGENFTSFKNDYSDFKQTMNGFKATVGQTYVTKDDFNGLEIGGVNLFVKSTASRGWWISDTGVLNANGGWGYSDYIDVSGMKNYIASGFTNLGISPATCFYDSNKTFISGVQSTNQNSQDSKRKTLPIPSDAKYMRFSFALADINTLKIEQGTKATVYSPSPYDDEINGQNLISNLPSNWEQGGINGGQAVGSTYASIKSSTTYRIRIKDIFSVSGNITVSAGGTTTNSSKETLSFYETLYDTKKGLLRETGWKSFPSTINCGDAKYMSIILRWGDGTKTQIAPSDISKICLKIERGTSATPFTLAPEDVNGKIQSVETIATQTADKFSWLVKSGTSSSNFELTDKTATLVADKINMDGLVTFNGLDSSARDRINTVTSGNLITVTPANPKSDYGGGQTYNVIADDKGGRCVQWNSSCASFLLLNSYTPVNFTSSDQLYYDIRVPNWSSTTFDTKLTIWFYNKNKALITSASKTLTLKSTIWNHFTGYLTLPSSSNWGDLYYYIIGLTNPNKQAIGFTNDSYIEKVNSYATAYAKNAVDWVGQNGTNTNNMYNMVSKWTDGAVSDTTQINGGWIKTNTITANKIAIGDFTNYSQLDKSSASIWGFDVTNDSSGMWFIAKSPNRDIFVSKPYPCQGGESYLIEYDISTNLKGSQNSSDTANYIDSAIGVYGYTGGIDNNGLPTKATNIWYAKRVTGSSDAPITHVQSAVTTSDTTKQIRIFLQTNAFYNFNGKIKIRNLSVRKMTTGNLIVDGSITADKIATDAIKSRNYISSGGMQGSFLNLSDGSFKSPNLSWDSNGNLIAKNANLSGEITAKDGTIGKYKITDQWLITGSGSTCTGIGGNQAFWAGAEDSNSAPFRVNYDGSMISTKGKIGDWKIDKMGLYNDFIVTFGVDQSDGTWLETFYTNYSAKTLYKANAFNNIFLGNKICCMDTHTEYTYLNDNSNKGDITYVESVILENGRINLHSSQYSDSRFALIPYDNYGSHLTLSGEAIEFSSYEADGTYSERNVDAKYTYTYISSDTIKTADVYCSNILRTNNLLVYEIISGRDIHLTSSANQIQLNASNQGSIELYGQTPFIDFHYNYSGDDYTSRIIANGSNLLSITGNLWVDVDIHAGSWLYASEVHTSGAVVIASDSESFYWAHGYQIARGTSWGGVCVGDDSQQLRLYGSSIWAAHGISTSDENLKENFTTLDQYEDFYMNLNPIGFNYIGDYDGKKTHFGFGAHKTEDILESEGYDSDKFAVVTHRPLVQEDIEKRFGKDIDVDIETEYGVSYTEFIALNTHMIQKTRRELIKVRQEKADLEARLQAIEAKLGL